MDNEVMLTNATETTITLNLPFANAHFLELLQVMPGRFALWIHAFAC
jgi:hypothetical protein